MIKNLNNCIYQDFVHPEICKKLVEAGLNANTHFHWRQAGEIVSLHTNVFDLDGYYKTPLAIIDGLQITTYNPAYSIGDMINLLPGFLLNKNNNEFEISCEDVFKMDVETASRLPDVLAKAVLKGIRHRKLDAAVCTNKLNATI